MYVLIVITTPILDSLQICSTLSVSSFVTLSQLTSSVDSWMLSQLVGIYETAVLKVLSDILLAIYDGNLSALELLDLSAAFTR